MHVLHTCSVILGLGGARRPLRTSLEHARQCTVKPSRLCRSRPKADNSLVSLHILHGFITHCTVEYASVQPEWVLQGKNRVAQKIIKKYLQIAPGDSAPMVVEKGMRCCYKTTVVNVYAPTPSKNIFYRPQSQKKAPTTGSESDLCRGFKNHCLAGVGSYY